MTKYVFRVTGNWESTITVDAADDDDAWQKAGDECIEIGKRGVLTAELDDDFEITDAEIWSLDWTLDACDEVEAA